MARTPDNLSPRKNPSEERLRATPFKSVADLEAEAEQIRLNVWRRLDEARVFHELLTKPQYKFVLDEWQEGLSAGFAGPEPTKMFRVFSEGRGLKLELNKAFTATLGDHEAQFFEGVVRAGLEGFGSMYFRTKGFLSSPEPSLGAYGPKQPSTKKKNSSVKKGR